MGRHFSKQTVTISTHQKKGTKINNEIKLSEYLKLFVHESKKQNTINITKKDT